MYVANVRRDQAVNLRQLPGQIIETLAYDGKNHAYICIAAEEQQTVEEESYQKHAVWRLDVSTGQTTTIAEVDGQPLALSRQGDKLLLLEKSNEVVLLRELSSEDPERIPISADALAGAISSDGSLVAVANQAGNIRAWDASTMELLFDQSALAGNEVELPNALVVTISADNQWIALQKGRQDVLVWNVSSGRVRHVNDQGISNVSFSDHSRQFVVSGEVMHFLDLDDSDAPIRVERLRELEGGIVDYSPDGELLAVWSLRSLQVYRPRHRFVVTERNHPIIGPRLVSFDDTGNRLVCIGDTEFFVWDFRETEDTHFDSAHFGNVGIVAGWTQEVAALDDPARIAFGGINEDLIIWSPETGELQRISGDQDDQDDRGASAVAFSSDGRLAASGDPEGNIIVWDVANKRLVHSFDQVEAKYSGGICLAFSPDATKLVVGNPTHLAAWDIVSGKKLWAVPGDGKVVEMRYLADGLLVEGGGEPTPGRLRLWNTAGKEPKLVKKWPHDRMIWSIAVSPDGRHLATIENEHDTNFICLYDLTTPEKAPRVWPGETMLIFAVSFSDDGQTVMTAGLGFHIHMYSVATGKEVARLKSDYVITEMETVRSSDGRIGVVLARPLWPMDDRPGHEVRIHWVDKQAVDAYWRAKKAPLAN